MGTTRPRKTPSKIDRAELGRRVEALRCKLGLSRHGLSERTGLSESAVGRIERGQARPSPELLRKLAAALGVGQHLLQPVAPPEGLVVLQLATPLRTGFAEKARARSEGSATVGEGGAEWPPGLEGFLERHAEKESITAEERRLLAGQRPRVEPWVVFDDRFWLALLNFWRNHLREFDAEGVGAAGRAAGRDSSTDGSGDGSGFGG